MPGADTFVAELSSLRDRINDPRAAFQAAASEFHQVQDDWFSGGAGWEPLADTTWSRKTGSQMMVESGGLLDSMTSPNSEWSIVTQEGDEIRLGSSAPHAHLHHQGTGNRMPARPLLDTSEQADQRIVNAFSSTLLSDQRFGL